MMEAIKTSRVTIKGNDGRTITVGLPDDADPTEYVAVTLGSNGWVTVVHAKETFVEQRELENGGYSVHKAIRRVTIPCQIVAEIHEEFAD